MPPVEQDAANAVSRWPSFLDAAAKELEAWNASAAQITALDLTTVPMLVVCSPSSPEHVAQQRHIASLSTDATYVEINVGHMGMLLNRDQAEQTATVIEAFIGTL